MALDDSSHFSWIPIDFSHRYSAFSGYEFPSPWERPQLCFIHSPSMIAPVWDGSAIPRMPGNENFLATVAPENQGRHQQTPAYLGPPAPREPSKSTPGGASINLEGTATRRHGRRAASFSSALLCNPDKKRDDPRNQRKGEAWHLPRVCICKAGA